MDKPTYYKDLPKLNLKKHGAVMCVIDKQHIAEMDFKGIKQILDTVEIQKAYNVIVGLFFISRGNSVKVFFEYIISMVSKYPEMLFYTAMKRNCSPDGMYMKDCDTLIMYTAFIWYVYKKFHHLVPGAKSYAEIKEKVRQTLYTAGYNFIEAEAFFEIYMNEKDVYEQDFEEILKELFPSYPSKIK